jgi:trehalose-6-phosphate synthase
VAQSYNAKFTSKWTLNQQILPWQYTETVEELAQAQDAFLVQDYHLQQDKELLHLPNSFFIR